MVPVSIVAATAATQKSLMQVFGGFIESIPALNQTPQMDLTWKTIYVYIYTNNQNSISSVFVLASTL